MISNKHRKTFAGIALVLVSLATAWIAASGIPGSMDAPAAAQSLDPCVEYRLCVVKETIGGDSVFRFDYVIDDEPEQEEQCLRVRSAIEDDGSFFLSDGESQGLFFQCSIRVIEVPQPGWQLVDIDCDFDPREYEVSRISSGIRILYNPENFDGSQFGIDCTFVNRRAQEPLNLGGLFAGQPTPLPTAPPPPAAVAPAPSQGISPPRTGDSGLK